MGTKSRTARSRLGGVPTSLPPVAVDTDPARQLSLAMDTSAPRRTREVLPAVIHIPGWLDLDTQRDLASAFRRWALPPAGLRHPPMPTGQAMSVQSVCLGLHWSPYAHPRPPDDTDGSPVNPLSRGLIDLAHRAVAAAYGEEHPDVA